MGGRQLNIGVQLSSFRCKHPCPPQLSQTYCTTAEILEDSRSDHYGHAPLSRDPGSAPGQLNLMQKGQVRGVWGHVPPPARVFL